MLDITPETRITVDEALRHPWITQADFNPADSCGSLAAQIAGLEFTRRKINQERTLLAQAPGLPNPASQNPSKVHVDLAPLSNPPDSLDAQTKAFINVGGKAGDETLYGDSFYKVSQDSEVGGEQGESL